MADMNANGAYPVRSGGFAIFFLVIVLLLLFPGLLGGFGY